MAKKEPGQLTPEQRYWSLHGTFEAFTVLVEKLNNGEFKSPAILKQELQSGMEQINILMNQMESELGINQLDKTLH